VVTPLKKRGAELQELCLATAHRCGVRPSLSPPPTDHAALDRPAAVLPGHVEHVVLKGAYHGSSIALGQMVSHFDEIDAAMIAEGLAAGRSDEELYNIEEQVRPHARLTVSRVEAKILLTGLWSLKPPADV
jgi:hypothetical protein